MPQQTNLNVSPYFDDFDSNSNYHKVLFKPGYPVQARELTTLQSILQNQVEKFGQHFFKEGAKVIPGNISYNATYFCIQLNNTFQGVPVSAYVDQLVGNKITGNTSGITAYVDSVLLSSDSERGNLTLYINYLGSATDNNSTETFLDGEDLTCNVTITSGLLGNTTIAPGSPIATTIASNAASAGSAFSIQEGIYFIRGNFVNVSKETLILDQYANTPNYRIGLYITEEVINANLDENLNDNSQGFNNYSSPGADRLKISTRLFKKSLTDFQDDNFIELATIKNGVLQSKPETGDLGGGPGYNDIEDTLARRTYSESGDYYVKPFTATLLESLNNGLGNRGVYNSNQLTYGGRVPSDNLLSLKVSPGEAFIRGYQVSITKPTYIDVEKPRTTKTIENQEILYSTGSTLKINRVYRSPEIGIGNTYYLSLRDQRVGADQDAAPGKEIGLARVYDFALESGSYDATNANLNQWDISLFDVRTFTELTLNNPVTITTPTYIKGANSGASAFLRYDVSAGTALTVYETSGSFIENESLIFDGIQDGRIAIAITEYGISQVKSLYGTDNYLSGVSTFSADVIQNTFYNVGVATISATSGGVSTITSPNPYFPGTIVSENDLISYSDTSLTDPVIGRVVSVGSSTVAIAGVANVTGIANGTLPSSSLQVTDLKILQSSLNFSEDRTLFTVLPQPNISNVDLSNAELTIRRTFSVDISGNRLSSAVSSGTNETFLNFDEERYALIRSDGTTEELTSDRFFLTNGNTTLQINNLGTDDTGATLFATLKKTNVKAKKKINNRVGSVIIDKSRLEGSGIGSTTLNDGLTYGTYPYGTRVQDELISLNVPDIMFIYGIYEATNVSDNPSAPTVILSNINTSSTTTTEFVVGEKFVGQSSGAIAVYAEKITDSQISFIYQNDFVFTEGETITFNESKSSATITTLGNNSTNISNNYRFGTGQKATFYDYGFLKREEGVDAPSKKIKVYYQSGYYDSTDTGDITTVQSYETFDYGKDIQEVLGISNSDILDIRPRVLNYSVSSSAQRSPLEFLGRTFGSTGQSAANALASDESIRISYSYYLGRIDRLFLSKDGRFQLQKGTPADDPGMPIIVDDAIEVANITYPPYLYRADQADIKFLENKGYKMSDIKNLEDRIKSLEYYTSLSLLETATSNLFIADNDGLNRFKSGFFVDNFTTFLSQDTSSVINNSLDPEKQELRPKHYTNSIDLVFGPVVNVDNTIDQRFATIEGTNVRKQNDILTLDYAEVEYIKQTFGTRCESLTPFLISFWQGGVDLTPASDTWVDTVILEPKVTEVEGNYSQTIAELNENGANIDPQTGYGEVIWGSWQSTWVGEERTVRHAKYVNKPPKANNSREVSQVGPNSYHVSKTRRAGKKNESTTEYLYLTGPKPKGSKKIRSETQITTTLNQERTGTQTIVTEQFDNQSLGQRVISRDLTPYMRSRNVEFNAKKLKPSTRIYAFFDNIEVTSFCTPKLLEISMLSGTFQVGETIVGMMPKTGITPNDNAIPTICAVDSPVVCTSPDNPSTPTIVFRASQLNHKEGPYNTPTKTYTNNPYTGGPLPSTYSSTSTILNIDTYSLSLEAQGQFFGYAKSGMTLVGQTSGATATVTNLRLVSDISSDLIGSFYIPDPNSASFPRFEAGSKTFTLCNDENNTFAGTTTLAEDTFISSGVVETLQEEIVSVRNASFEQTILQDSQTVTETTYQASQKSVNRIIKHNAISRAEIDFYNAVDEKNLAEINRTCYTDPLAQSFLVEEPSGVFLTKCDVYFCRKDDMDIPVNLQLRTMRDGYPTTDIIPLSDISLSPSEITTALDGSVATTFQFKAPVYLQGGTEYAICLISNSVKYEVAISRVNEIDMVTGSVVSNQPYLGSLFKSQNASTWEASQWEDLKFTLYRADFVRTGSVELYNPELTVGNKQIPQLNSNALGLISKKIRVGLGTTIADSGYVIGNTFTQAGTNATGNLVGVAASAVGTLTVSNPGIGLTPSDPGDSLTFNNVNLVTITGSGRGAQANITVSGGSIVSAGATISNNGGSGYKVGDVLGITTIGDFNVGRNVRLTVAGIGVTNELILDNVQGNFLTGAANTMFYTNSSGITTELNFANGGNVIPANIYTVTDGLHIKVNHKNHGMYFNDNEVRITGVSPDIIPTKLSATYGIDSTDALSVVDASAFTTFENVGVGTTNTGYLLIGGEVIEYTNVSGNLIGGDIVRGTGRREYPIGTPVYKYELGGINLSRINKVHDLNDVTVSDPITYDSYHIKLDMSEKFNSENDDRSDDSGYPQLFINETKSAGGFNIRASQNMPFEVITPMVQNVTVPGTSISAEIRTTTSKSISGNEIPYVDNGYEPIILNQINYLDSPRMVASKLNENNKLSNVQGNKSMNMRLFLTTDSTLISPVIDAQRINTILTSNRVNDVITNYAEDARVNTLNNDPTACQYVTKEISLENPASSIKVLLDAHINTYNDIRAFYAINTTEGRDPIFVPFPGYSNLNSRGEVISKKDNDGSSDKYVTKTSIFGFNSSDINYSEYEFNIDNLPSFNSYRIKIVMTSTSQTYVPRMKNLRVLALA